MGWVFLITLGHLANIPSREQARTGLADTMWRTGEADPGRCLMAGARGRRMQAREREVLRARAEIIKALAHPTRLFIVEDLERSESCVAEITAKVGADMSTVSRHLSILKDAGIVQSVKRGAQVYYSLRVPCILNFFGCVEAVLRASAEEQVKLARAAGQRR